MDGVPESTQKILIANALDRVIRQLFPESYQALCHLYAIVGAVVLSHCYGRDFIPVAGIAMIPTGDGLLEMLDEGGFFRSSGGAYHCWIESSDPHESILVDFAFKNNEEYAATCGVAWKRESQDFLWGDKFLLNIGEHEMTPPTDIPVDKVWYRRTVSGMNWIDFQLTEKRNEYAKVCSFVLYQIRRDIVEATT